MVYFQTPINVMEMIQVTLWPSFCLSSKAVSSARQSSQEGERNVSRPTAVYWRKNMRAATERGAASIFQGILSVQCFVWRAFLVMALVHIARNLLSVMKYGRKVVNKIPFCNKVLRHRVIVLH